MECLVYIFRSQIYSTKILRPLWNKYCLCVIFVCECPIFCSPVYYSPPDSSVYGIFQARILKWVAISFSKGSSQPRNQPHLNLPFPASSSLAGRFFTTESPFVPLGNKCGFYAVTISVEKSETSLSCFFMEQPVLLSGFS